VISIGHQPPPMAARIFRINNADRSEQSFTLPKLPRSIPPRTARLAYARENDQHHEHVRSPQSTLNTTAPAIIANAICKRPIVIRGGRLAQHHSSPGHREMMQPPEDASRPLLVEGDSARVNIHQTKMNCTIVRERPAGNPAGQS